MNRTTMTPALRESLRKAEADLHANAPSPKPVPPVAPSEPEYPSFHKCRCTCGCSRLFAGKLVMCEYCDAAQGGSNRCGHPNPPEPQPLESGKAATPEVTNRKVITAADIEALNADRHSCGHALNRNPACGCMCGRSYLPDWGVLISRQGRFPPACKCVPVPPAAQVTDVAKLRWLRDHMSQAVHDFGISGRHDVSMHLEFALGNIDKALTAKKEGS